MALVSGISLDPEAAIGVTKRSPPKWVDGVDEVSFCMLPFVGLSFKFG
jgi:syntaxin 16